MTSTELHAAHALYQLGHSLEAVGQQYGTSGQSLHRLFRAAGLPTRKRGTLTKHGLEAIRRQKAARLCPGCDSVKLKEGEVFCKECTEEGILLGDLPAPPTLELPDPAAEKRRELAAREAADGKYWESRCRGKRWD